MSVGVRTEQLPYFDPNIRNILVPHFGQVPVIALRVLPPFPFIVTSFSPVMSLFALHFTQYPSVAMCLVFSL